MKNFVVKALPFLAILIIYGGVGEYYLFKNKESISIKKVAEVQSTSTKELYYHREILGNALSNYKFEMFKKIQPKVLVLGQSVTLQFRDFMFEPYQDDFYNTGLMARNVKDLNFVMDLIEGNDIKKPEIILLGFDVSFVLKHTILDDIEWTRTPPEDRATSAKSHLKGMQRIFLTPKYRTIPATDFGFGRSGMTGRGYRNDGSFRHKPEIEMYLADSTYYDGDLIKYLKNRTAPFDRPFIFDAEKAQQYLALLNRIKENNIELILYIPPYSDVYFNEAMKDTMFNSFWQDFEKFQQTLEEENLNIIPFATPSKLGLTDHFMVDAEHPSEVFCALQLKDAFLRKKIKGEAIDSLSFTTVDELLAKQDFLPISFLKDSINIDVLKKLKNKHN